MFEANIETLIIFGTFERRAVALRSLESLSDAVRGWDAKIIVSDATSVENFSSPLSYDSVDEYIWTPGNINMATSRNLAVSLGKEKYCFDWLLFLEDDLLYETSWYPELLGFANAAYGKRSPLGLSYGSFSASSHAVTNNDDTVDYDKDLDAYASLFGLRADQRLYKASHYSNITKFWDSDLLGISSAQTGKMNSRDTMRGYCGGSIGHRKLCSYVEDETSTWDGIRDIGPAAFDKRINGYKSIRKIASEMHVSGKKSFSRQFKSENSLETIDKNSGKNIPSIKPVSSKTMTSKIPFQMITFKVMLKRFAKAFRIILIGK